MNLNERISDWFDEAKNHDDSYLLVVCDTFSYEDYPVYVKKMEDLQAALDTHSRNMQKVLLTIDLSKPKPKYFRPA